MSDHLLRLEWFKTIVLPHEPALRRHLAHIGAPSSDIEDIAAEALARAYAAPGWGQVAYGRSYLFAIARNILIDSVRRRQVVHIDLMAELETLGVADQQPLQDEVLSAREEFTQLKLALAKLPERRREVLIRRRIDGLSVDEIAKEMNISVSTVGKHLTKALAQLADFLGAASPQTPTGRSQWSVRRRNS